MAALAPLLLHPRRLTTSQGIENAIFLLELAGPQNINIGISDGAP